MIVYNPASSFTLPKKRMVGSMCTSDQGTFPVLCAVWDRDKKEACQLSGMIF